MKVRFNLLYSLKESGLIPGREAQPQVEIQQTPPKE